MNNIFLAAALAISGGVFLVTQNSNQDRRTPEQAIEQFIRGIILVDANILADALGKQQSGEEMLAEKWGSLAPLMERRERREPRNPDDFSWNITDVNVSPTIPTHGTAKVEISVPDTTAQARRIREILGARYNAEGRFIGYDPNTKITLAEAAEMAANDPNIAPLRYNVPAVGITRRHKDSQRWAVDEKRKYTMVLLDIVMRGDDLESNQQYQVKP